MFRRLLRRAREEKGQAFILMALGATALMGMTGLAVDGARLYVARTELTRTADAAALAGVASLPDVTKATADAKTYGALNDPTATITPTKIAGESKIKVDASKTVNMYFMRFLGIQKKTVKASATAGFGGILDLVLVIDTTGSMSGDAMDDAIDAAKQFVDQVLPDPSGNTMVGMVPYKSCYNPPGTNSSCVATSKIKALTNNATALKNAITPLTAGGTTNICMGLERGNTVLFGAGMHSDPKTDRIIVLLADGDNNPQDRSTARWTTACDPGGDSSTNGASCQSTSSREAQLDDKMYDLAKSMKDNGVEIYVVGLSVCGTTNTSTLCDVNKVGDASYSDSTADRNLLKCIASSKTGTNDHYFETKNSADLDGIFNKIAGSITTRLVK